MSHPLAPLRRVYDVEPPHMAGDPSTAGDPVETELLHGMRRVLEAHPVASPSASAVQAVLDRAEAASSTARTLHEAYTSAAPLSGEAEVLRQSRTILDRASASQPRHRPDSEVETLILVRAAEASSVVRAATPASVELEPVAAAYGLTVASGAEANLLGSTRDALDRLPRHQPDPSTLDAVLALAAQGVAPVKAPAPDRTAAPSGARRRRVGGLWAGSAALFAVALIAVVMNPFEGTRPQLEGAADDTPTFASQIDSSPEAGETRAAASLEPPAPEASAPLAAATSTPPLVQRSAPRGPSAQELTPVRAEGRSASPMVPTPVEAEQAPGEVVLADAVAVDASSVPEWNVSDDVRLLSLRLQELRRQNQGLGWDQPAEAFGAPASTTTTQPGIQTVRQGAAPVRAQVRVRSDSARSNQ